VNLKRSILSPLLLATTLGIVAACTERLSANGEDQQVTTTNERIAQLLQLTNEGYFSISEDQLLDLQDALSDMVESEEAANGVEPLVALGAPRHLNLNSQNSVPILLGSFQTGLRAWQVNFDPNTYIFVHNHTTGELIHSQPLVNMRRGRQPRPSGVGDPPDELNATSTSSGVVNIDLLEKMPGRLRPGINSLTAVVYDIRSNTVHIQLDGEAQHEPPSPTPSDFVDYQLDNSSVIDTRITVPATASARHGIEIGVTAQLTDEQARIRTEGDQSQLTFHLIFVRLDEHPISIPVHAPVQATETPEGQTAYNARFTVKLGSDEGPSLPSGDYRAYCSFGAEFLGPYPLTVTD
jgi:hypothetical protein